MVEPKRWRSSKNIWKFHGWKDVATPDMLLKNCSKKGHKRFEWKTTASILKQYADKVSQTVIQFIILSHMEEISTYKKTINHEILQSH
jgi:hypothetical protein